MSKAENAPVQAEYAHGHDETVLKSHLWRTIENSCFYLIPRIEPDMKILDVGCGPGNLTCDFARLVPQGSVIGLDRSEHVLDEAKKMAGNRGVTNISFVTGNIFSLDYPDDEFDIVHAHQVLQHVGDVSSAMKEMYRVAKPGGIIATRDLIDYLHWPVSKELELFGEVFHKIAERIGGVPKTGAKYRKFAREAGIAESDIWIGAGTWCYATKEDLEWWCGKN
jgi:ubiquinone/menaquinone biosynthesis C-methylase UbiE